MAYGKQPLGSANVGGWRARAQAGREAKGAIMKRKPFAGSRFANQYRPPLGVTDIIRLIPGQYKVERPIELERGKFGLKPEVCEFYEAAEHYDGKTGQSTICSAGPLWFRKQYAQPCIPCKARFNSPMDANNRRKSRFSRRDLFIFTVLGYGTYAEIEQIDQNGLVKCSPKTGKPYTEWVKKTQGLTGILREKEGHLMHWAVGQGHMDVIQGYDALIGKTCAHCGTKDGVVRRALLCQKCGTDIVDCSSTSIDDKEQERMLREDVECSYCHHKAPLTEFLECLGCTSAARSSVFDVDISLQRLDTPGNTQLIFTNWSAPHPVDPSYKVQPMDLPAMYQPDGIDIQERRFGMTLQDLEDGTGDIAPNEGNDEPQQHARPYNS